MSEIDQKELERLIYNFLYDLAQNWDAYKRGEIKSPVTFEEAVEHFMSLIQSACWLKGKQPIPQYSITNDSQACLAIARNHLLKAGFKPCKEWDE